MSEKERERYEKRKSSRERREREFGKVIAP